MNIEHIVSRGHTRPVTEISFVEDGPSSTLLVSSAHDKLPQVRNGETGDWIGSFKGHKGAVWSTKVDSLTRTLAATASGDFSAKLWCASTGKELHDFKHRHVVKSIDFSKDTERIATGCQDGLARIYDTCRPEEPPMEIRISPSGTEEAITKISWVDMNNMSLLMVGKRSGKVQLWDTRCPENAVTSRQLTSTETVMDMEINPTHNCILVACDRTVSFLSFGDLSITREYAMPSPMHFKDEGGVSLSPDGTKFLSGASDLWLREFDVASGECLRTIKGHHGPIRCVR
jgi:serine-threonine kinase receptor-associated protein